MAETLRGFATQRRDESLRYRRFIRYLLTTDFTLGIQLYRFGILPFVLSLNLLPVPLPHTYASVQYVTNRADLICLAVHSMLSSLDMSSASTPTKRRKISSSASKSQVRLLQKWRRKQSFPFVLTHQRFFHLPLVNRAARPTFLH